MEIAAWHWPALLAVLTVLLLIDILVVHRRAHVIDTREAVIESIVWVSIGLGVSIVMLTEFGGGVAGDYLASYAMEKSLSIDNVFVWSVILTHFRIPEQYQHRVLFWGIFGALAMRLSFIFAGIAVIDAFRPTLIIFGAFLVYTGLALFGPDEEHFDPDSSRALRLIRRVVPSSEDFDGQKLFTRRNGVLLATPLFAVLLLLEITDVLFAVDSVPAVLAITEDHYVAFASNAFAILGLRALYFLLADLRHRFVYMSTGLGVILVFVGAKMALSYWWHMPNYISLSVIGLVLGSSVVLSLVRSGRGTEGRSPSH